jgi:hypothetical protein
VLWSHCFLPSNFFVDANKNQSRVRNSNDTVGERRAKKKKKQAEEVVEKEEQLQTEEEDVEQQQHVHCIAGGFKSFQQHLPTLIQRRGNPMFLFRFSEERLECAMRGEAADNQQKKAQFLFAVSFCGNKDMGKEFICVSSVG